MLDDYKKLSKSEVKLLKQANEAYKNKRFEYIDVNDVATAYSSFPDLDELSSITKKVISFEIKD